METENEKVEISKDYLSLISLTSVIAAQKLAQVAGGTLEGWIATLSNLAEKQLEEIKRTRPEQIDEIIESHKKDIFA